MLEHIGDSCIKKLKELQRYIPKTMAGGYVLPAALPGGSVHTVGHMAAVVVSVRHDRVAEANIFRKALKLNDVRSCCRNRHRMYAVHKITHRSDSGTRPGRWQTTHPCHRGSGCHCISMGIATTTCTAAC